MGIKETALNVAIKQGIEYVKKDYDTNLFKLMDDADAEKVEAKKEKYLTLSSFGNYPPEKLENG